jgi:hypothetical protein
MPRLAAFESVRDYMFRTVAQITLNYRGCPLSRGRAGRIEGGDRLPWVECEGADNYAPLNAMTWQVHVYGAANAELAAWCKDHNVALHVFDWRAAFEAAGLTRNAFYLLRPDTYIALADAAASPLALQRYFADQMIEPGAKQEQHHLSEN